MNWRDKFLNQIVCGDCLELMPEIPDGVVDLVVTDPPYFNKGTKSKYRRKGRKDVNTDFGEWDKFNSDGDYLKFIKKFIKEAHRILTENGSIYIFANDRYISYIRHNLKSVGLTYATTIVWHKYNSPPRFIMKAGFISSKELIAFAYKGNSPTFNKPQKFKDMLDVWITTQTPISERCGHPTQKPLFLIEKIIEISSNENMLVLDSFVGSGTTTVAAKNLGRNFIGFENKPDYCEMARKRLAQEVLL